MFIYFIQSELSETQLLSTKRIVLGKSFVAFEYLGDGVTYRTLAEKYKISSGSVTNIVECRDEYVFDYENNGSKEWKRKVKNDIARQFDDVAYQWFCNEIAKEVPISDTIL